MKNQIKQPNSITLNMSGAQWAEINRLCSQLNINPYDYAKTTSKKAGLLIYDLSKCCVCGIIKFPIPNPEDYIEVKK